jgi:hypothetical protein
MRSNESIDRSSFSPAFEASYYPHMRAYMEHWITLANGNNGVLPVFHWGDWVSPLGDVQLLKGGSLSFDNYGSLSCCCAGKLLSCKRSHSAAPA